MRTLPIGIQNLKQFYGCRDFNRGSLDTGCLKIVFLNNRVTSEIWFF